MPPKTPKRLLDQLLRRNKNRSADGHSMTAEGMKAENPSRGEFFSNLENIAHGADSRRTED